MMTQVVGIKIQRKHNQYNKRSDKAFPKIKEINHCLYFTTKNISLKLLL